MMYAYDEMYLNDAMRNLGEAFYPWHTSKSFKEIKKFLPMSEIYKLYPTLHEASNDSTI